MYVTKYSTLIVVALQLLVLRPATPVLCDEGPPSKQPDQSESLKQKSEEKSQETHKDENAPGPACQQEILQQPEGATFPGAALVNDHSPFLAGIIVDHRNGVYREGEKLNVAFLAERESHLYLVYHQADGSSCLLFPNTARPKSQVPARQTVTIPAAGEKFRFRVRPPFGMEVLQVLASTGPIVELDQLAKSSRGAPSISAELIADLAARLKQDPTLWTEYHLQIRTIPREQQPLSRKPVRAGLFIGIGKYQNHGKSIAAPPHEQLRKSAEVLAKAMVEHGHLDPKLSLLLRDEQATRANIQKAIGNWLPSVTRPNDTVFIYFSGHSGQLPSASGDESDQLDEVLGPYDLDAGPKELSREKRAEMYRQTSIVDDTLARWLEGLQGRHVVVILDTCHSGGFAGSEGSRDVFADEIQRIRDIAQLNTTVLTSCNVDEQALFEGTPNNTMWFTYFLAEAVENAGKYKDLPKPLTVQQAHQYVLERIKEVLKQQDEVRVQRPALSKNTLYPVVLVP